jgi:nicotinamidase-related amidase
MNSPTNLPAPALIIIDAQVAFDDPDHWGGARNNPDAEANIARLLVAWRAAGLPVMHVVHDSVEPGSILTLDSPGGAIKPEAEPVAGEPIITKHVNSAFIGTGLEERLRRAGIDQIVLAGLTTNHCVSTTTRMAGNLGFDTYVVADATAAFPATGSDGTRYPADLVHATALASLHREFATVVTADEAIERFAS